ncbi:hypothetical protein Gxy13693_042_051 [Komagataeibacter xylinus NBRC 13693]|uniref:Uncharacterized protein n=1 Tax=Komagataeibacter xylinus NBRC 13693 TaxID=1234668 RepID=A0A0D6QBN1_KOMXY|nr:hypothetical protein Gxy13693_042_051 [Komagataeibacter xylinus NBRC 13693]
MTGVASVAGFAFAAGVDACARPVARACEATVAVWALEVALSAIPTVDRAVLAARIFVIRQLINGFTLR